MCYVKNFLKQQAVVVACTTGATAAVMIIMNKLLHLPVTWLHALVLWGILTVAIVGQLAWDFYDDWFRDMGEE